MEMEGLRLKVDIKEEEHMASEMEIDYSGTQSPKFEIESKISELGEGSNVVFAREGPLYMEDAGISKVGCYGAKKQKSKGVTTGSQAGKKGNVGNEKKLSRQDRIELGKLFQSAVSSHDWDLAESLILFADPLTLNDFLCISLDSIWFLTTHEELHGITGLVKKIITNGAYDFTRAALRTSFLASCVSACQSRTMDLADTVTVMAQRYLYFHGSKLFVVVDNKELQVFVVGENWFSLFMFLLWRSTSFLILEVHILLTSIHPNDKVFATVVL